jgi:argininosuccinate lyase
MPQKRNPVALVHARAIASKAVGQAGAITAVVHNTPFGDIVDTEDDLQPLVAVTFRDAVRAVTLAAASLRGAELDVVRLQARAAEGGTTLTELADHLVRTHNVPFMTAHAIAARLMQTRRERPDAPLGAVLSTVSGDLLGVPLQYSDAQIAEVMSPRHFVEVRKSHGGPAPAETTRALQESRERRARDRSWLDARRAAIARAAVELKARSASL